MYGGVVMRNRVFGIIEGLRKFLSLRREESSFVNAETGDDFARDHSSEVLRIDRRRDVRPSSQPE
jgi:hypothetical protein